MSADGLPPRDWHRSYDADVPPSLRYEQLTLPAVLRRTAERNPSRPALHAFGTNISYASLAEQAGRLAGALAELGVARGSRVAIQLPNLPQGVIAFYAALSLGAQVVLTNPLYTDDEVEHQWRDAGCTVAFVLDYAWVDRLVRLRKRLPVRHWIACSLADPFPLSQRWLALRRLRREVPARSADLSGIAGVTGFRELLARGRGRAPADASAWSDVAVLQYTGGTTGSPKAAMLLHSNLVSNVQQLRAWLAALQDGHEVFLAVLPYFHVFGMQVCLNLPVWLGATIVLQPDPRDAAQLLRNIERQRVTVLALVPTLFAALASRPEIERADLSSVKGCFSGSAPLTRETLERFERLTGGRIFEGYGLTETSAGTHVNPIRGERRVGTVGLPLPDTDARIVDAGDGTTEVPPGAEGELLVAGPQVMAGYWNRPDETAQVLRGGWLHTGDLAVRDAEGYFRIVGRKKEMIVVGGYKVYPDEVDRALAGHPEVLEAATIGVPDVRRGESVKSFVVRRPGASVRADELRAFCRERLAAYKVPRSIEFRAELPRSSMLKVLRRELLRQELARLQEPGQQERPS